MKKLITTGIALAMVSTNIVTSFAFSDVSEKHWAKKEIDEYVNRGVLGGYEDGTFKPSQNITRAEFVKVMNKAFGLTEFNYDTMLPSEASFNDINAHWAKSEIMIAVSNGIYDYVLNKDLNKNFNFRPNDYITREEASAMIANYLKINDSNINKLNYFSDNNKVVYWAKQGVEGLIENNILNGYEDKTIRPQGNLTRAEAVLMVQRAEKVKKQQSSNKPPVVEELPEVEYPLQNPSKPPTVEEEKPVQQPSNNNSNDSSNNSNTSIPKFDIVSTPVSDMIEYINSIGYDVYTSVFEGYSHEKEKGDDDYGVVIAQDGRTVKKYEIRYWNQIENYPEGLKYSKMIFKPFFDDATIDKIFDIHIGMKSGEFGTYYFNGVQVDIGYDGIAVIYKK